VADPLAQPLQVTLLEEIEVTPGASFNVTLSGVATQVIGHGDQ
jgi:hypothetical protein